MLQFTRVLHVEGHGLLQFNFNCIVSPAKRKYHINVLTSTPQCFHLMMDLHQGGWKITEAPRPPEWILGIEERLSQAIINQHADAGILAGLFPAKAIRLYPAHRPRRFELA